MEEAAGNYHRPMLREQPYRLCFPVGVLLAAAGILHWLAYAHGLLADYRPIFHVTAQVQGFLSCFAAGFLLTMLPRRLQASLPPTLAVVAVPAGFTAAVVLTWFRHFTAAQLVWSATAAIPLAYATRLILGSGAGRRAPNAFVWILVALGMGVGGSSLTLVAAAWSGTEPLLHQLGQDLVLQGMPLGLVIGVGSMALPLMTRDEPTPDGFGGTRDALQIAAHLAAAVLLMASFWLAATWSLRAGLLLRLGVVVAELAIAARLWRLPTRPGWNARLIWFSAWATATGFAAAAVWPTMQRAAMHLTFILGFALLSLAIGAQVSFGHGGRREEILGRPVAVPVVAALLLAATAARVVMDAQPERYWTWMGVAAVLLLAALTLWTAWVGPMWTQRRASRRSG